MVGERVREKVKVSVMFVIKLLLVLDELCGLCSISHCDLLES